MLAEQFSRNVEITPSYTLTLGDSPSAAVSAAAKGSLRYNHAATRFEASVDGGAWAALSGTFGGSIAVNQVAFGSGANTIAGNASLTWDNTLKKFAIDSSHTLASSGGLAWDALGLGGTLTLTGTTTVTALSLARLSAPTITDASAVTVTDAATLTISGAPVAAGSVTITNPWALRVASGDSQFVNVYATKFFALDGTSSLASISFKDDPGTGLYRVGTSYIGITTGGSIKYYITSTVSGSTIRFDGEGGIRTADGTAAAPGFAFIGSPAAGFFEAGANIVKISSASTERGTLTDATGNFVWGTAALATSATDGFLYITTVPGTPTGAATSYTGRSPLVIDSTNSLLYFRNGGAWVAAGTGTVTGTGVANRVAYWSGTSALTSDADLTFDGTTLGLDGPMNFLDSANPSAPSDGVTLWSKTDNIVSRDPDDCYHSVTPVPPSAGTATICFEKWFRVTSAGSSTTFDITLTSLHGVNTQVNNGVFYIEVIWLNNQTTTYSFTRQRRGCFHWDSSASSLVIMNTSSLETLEWGAAGGDMTLAVSGTADVRVTLSTSVSNQIDGRCFVRVLFADPA